MPETIYRMFAVAAAWLVALCFVRNRMGTALLHGVLTGAVCAASAYGLCRMQAEAWVVPAEAGVFVLSGLAVLLRMNAHRQNAWIAFSLAAAAFAVLGLPLRAYGAMGAPALWIGGIWMVCYAALTLCLRKRFPDSDWRGAFTGKQREDLPVAWQGMILLPTAAASLLFVVALLVPVETEVACIVIGLTESAVLWLCIWLMILIPAFAQKQTAVNAEQQYRSEMQSFLNVIRSQRHDYNFHVQTIAGLIKQGKIDDCLKYVNALEEDSAIMNAILPVKDPAIAALIHNFQVMAVREGIRLTIDIRYDLSQIATNVYETNKIISNLLQNAIDETVTHEDKSYGIQLTIIKRGEFCVIRVSNAILKVPDKETLGALYQQGYTTKKGHDGVGLSSLKTLVSKYHGVIYTEVENDVISFVARVPIDYAKVTTEE